MCSSGATLALDQSCNETVPHRRIRNTDANAENWQINPTLKGQCEWGYYRGSYREGPTGASAPVIRDPPVALRQGVCINNTMTDFLQ